MKNVNAAQKPGKEGEPAIKPYGGQGNSKKDAGFGESVEGQINSLRALAEEYKDMLQRLQAEFDNSRKRAERENEEFRKLANAKIIAEFLPLLDSLDEGIKQAGKSGNAEMAGGFEKIRKQMVQILERGGIRQVESIGKKFDHGLHEVMLAGNEKDKDEGVILEEFQKGFLLNGRLLRPAKVKVNKKD